MGEVMATWTMQMGFPVVFVRRRNNVVTVEQRRFLSNPDSSTTEEFVSPFKFVRLLEQMQFPMLLHFLYVLVFSSYLWKIPIDFITDSNSEPSAIKWLETKEMSFNLDNAASWIKVNVEMKGFYRVCYEDAVWSLLIDQLMKNHEVCIQGHLQ